mmetsp:Transcript_161775/g.392913  ORF Transcript_161775/g.392913 Transcript_161775/m.392913 type:complete len:307 (+) Transcript_161775:422-1342(+)
MQLLVTTTLALELKLPRLPQGKRDDAAISDLTLKKGLVVCMPAHGVLAIHIKIQIAAVGPLSFFRQPTQRHALCHQVAHPWRVWRRLYLCPPITISAHAWRSRHPCSSQWQGSPATFWLQPLRAFQHLFETQLGVWLADCTRKVTRKAAPPLIRQRVRPCGGLWSQVSKQLQPNRLTAGLTLYVGPKRGSGSLSLRCCSADNWHRHGRDIPECKTLCRRQLVDRIKRLLMRTLGWATRGLSESLTLQYPPAPAWAAAVCKQAHCAPSLLRDAQQSRGQQPHYVHGGCHGLTAEWENSGTAPHQANQ